MVKNLFMKIIWVVNGSLLMKGILSGKILGLINLIFTKNNIDYFERIFRDVLRFIFIYYWALKEKSNYKS